MSTARTSLPASRRPAPLPGDTEEQRPRPGRAAVELRNVVKRYALRPGWKELALHPFRRDWKTALDGVDLRVAEGECFGLLGPNGAGKTTLFKILSTLVLPDAGEVRVLGTDVSREPARVRRLLAPVIPEERSLFWRLTGRENLLLFASLQGLRAPDGRRRTEELLARVELEEAADRIVAQYSSGMKQRLLLARALLSRPRVLLLDEPTRSLDPLSARKFRRFIRSEVLDRDRRTVLLATHDTGEAMEVCDRIGILAGGHLLAQGTREALARTYGDARYRVWIRPADPALLRRLRRTGMIRSYRIIDDPGRDGAAPEGEGSWERVELEVPDEEEGAARVLAELAGNGSRVARFERVELPLVDLIERVAGPGAKVGP